MRRVRDRLPLLLILVLALLWRLALWAQPLHQPANDELEYVQVARDLLAGRGWVFYESWRWLRAPLYPLWLAGSLWLAGADPALSTAEALHRAALPNLLLSVLLVYLVYRLARELTPDRGAGPALAAALVAALLQTYATFASLYMSETLFSTLFAGGLLALARWRRSGRLWLAALAGALIGLACLTRSAALVFLPVAGLWMLGVALWERRQALLGLRRTDARKIDFQGGQDPPAAASTGRHGATTIVAPLLLALAAAAVIAPWTLRNCRAYEACILIETGGAYNLWAFYEPRESLEAINRTLEAIKSPVARADEATRRGLARLQEDPAIILRKLPAEWTRLWVVKPIQDRFLLPSAYSDPPPVLFLSALLLDDLLYLLVLCGAAYGAALALGRRDAFGLLLGLWSVVFVAATLFTHAEGRYRHFLLMAMIPLAAVALDGLRRRVTPARGLMPTARKPGLRRNISALQGGQARAAPRPDPASVAKHLAAGAALALALAPLLLFYPWAWAASGATRSFYRGAGDLMAWSGHDEAAARAYLAALAADNTPDGWLVLGDLRRRGGDTAGAEEAYELAHATERTYVGASAAWGDLLRAQGRSDEARRAFRGRYLDQQRLADWSYQMRPPAPVTTVAVGDGLDFGYVGGFYLAEEQQGALARWTDGRARLRLGQPGGPERRLLTLRAAAPRPDGDPVSLALCAGGVCETVTLGPGWRTVQVLLPAGAGQLELRSPTFFAPDGRDLGVLVDWARAEELGRAGERPVLQSSRG